MSFSTIATAAQVDINEVNTNLTCYFMLVVCLCMCMCMCVVHIHMYACVGVRNVRVYGIL